MPPLFPKIECLGRSKQGVEVGGRARPPLSPAKLPSSAIAPAACMKAPQATRERAEPTLMRRTPSSARSATRRPASAPISTLTGFGAAASTIAAIGSRSCGPGA